MIRNRPFPVCDGFCDRVVSGLCRGFPAVCRVPGWHGIGRRAPLAGRECHGGVGLRRPGFGREQNGRTPPHCETNRNCRNVFNEKLFRRDRCGPTRASG
mgnify:CR=1 FL=1